VGYDTFVPGNELFGVLTWLPFAVLFGFTAWLVASLTSGRGWHRLSVITRLRIAMPASGLGVSILGVALSFTCDPTSCSIHPLESYGVILSAIGLFVFLAGLILAAAFPPEATSVG
jgi:hypothetical protein